MSRFTVLGAGGYIGAALAAWLRAQGHDVFTPARGAPELYSEALGSVFYCSGMTANFLADPTATLHAHVNYLDSVLRRASFERITYLSSCRLYDRRPGEDCRESDPLKLDPSSPRHLFDLSKGLGENLCLTESSARGSVVRLACVYDASPGATGFLPALLRRLSQERAFALDSLPGNARDYVCLSDVLHALLAIAQLPQAGAIVNVASGENVSNQQLVDCINTHGFALSLPTGGTAATMPLCNATRLRELLGLEPTPVRRWIDAHLSARIA